METIAGRQKHGDVDSHRWRWTRACPGDRGSLARSVTASAWCGRGAVTRRWSMHTAAAAVSSSMCGGEDGLVGRERRSRGPSGVNMDSLAGSDGFRGPTGATPSPLGATTRCWRCFFSGPEAFWRRCSVFERRLQTILQGRFSRPRDFFFLPCLLRCFPLKIADW